MTALRIARVEKAFDYQRGLNPATTMYSPFVVDNNGEVLALAMGGKIDAPTPHDLLDPRHFADEIFRLDPKNPFAEPLSIINHRSFPWMQDRAYITAHPEAFVGSVGGPCVIRLGDVWHMLFSGSVSDPNVCTGEHGQDSPHGSCDKPWSYFAVFHATSADGITWTLENTGNDNPNIALQHALVYYEPTASEASGKFKGLDRVAGAVLMPTPSAAARDWLYMWMNMWTSGFNDPPTSTQRWDQRNVLTRLSGTTAAAKAGLWGGSGFDPYTRGELSVRVNTSFAGNPYVLMISHVTRTSFFSREDNREHFVLLSSAGNRFWYALSDDALTWTPPVQIASDLPAITGPALRLNPTWTQFDDGTCAIHYASNDQNADGVADCLGEYEGACVMRADVELSDAIHGGPLEVV